MVSGTMSDRSGKSFFYRPLISIQSCLQCSIPNPQLFRPISKALGLAVKCYKIASSLVPGLFFWGSPSTVFAAIVSVNINSVKRMFFCWRFAHISIKRLKVTPPTANADPSAAVVLPSFVVGIFASSLHLGPCSVDFCFRFPMSQARFLLFGGFNKKASARPCSTVPKTGTINDLFMPTIALTKPSHGLVFGNSTCLNYGQAAKLFPRQVDSTFWAETSTRFSLFQPIGKDGFLCPTLALAHPNCAVSLIAHPEKTGDGQCSKFSACQIFDKLRQYNIFSHAYDPYRLWSGVLGAYQAPRTPLSSLYQEGA